MNQRRRNWLGLVGAVWLTAAARGETLPGWEAYRQGEFDRAARLFAAAGTNDAAAVYGLATTWELRRPGEDAARAERLYRQVIALAPASDEAAWSWLALARLGKATYREVFEKLPSHAAGEEAFLFWQADRLTQPRPEAAGVLADLEKFLAERPQSPYRSAVWGLIGHCCRVLGRKEKLLEAALQSWRTAEVDPMNPVRDLAGTYWQIATIAQFDVGDFKMAREYYRKLIAEYPTDQRVFPARQELERMDAAEGRR